MWLILTIAGFLSATISATIGMAGGTFLLAIMLVVGLPPFVVIPLHAAVQLVSNCTRVIIFREHLKLKPFISFSFLWPQVPLLGCTFLKIYLPIPRNYSGVVYRLCDLGTEMRSRSLTRKCCFRFCWDFMRPVGGCYWGCMGPILAPLSGQLKKKS